jgi:hypothetical protein
MGWSQTGRILLVWPDHGHVLNRQLDLNLVKRHAEMVGAQLALVTHDHEVRFYAKHFGIPVFDSPRRAQDSQWKIIQSRKIIFKDNSTQSSSVSLQRTTHPNTSAKLEHAAIRFLGFGLSVLALFALGIFILPGAKINLFPQVEMQTMRFDLFADPSSTSINFSTGSLPTYNQDVIVEGRDTITSTGSTIIPDKPATGSLRFTNASSQEISIPAGTIVSTRGNNAVRFITSSMNDVPVNPHQSVLVDARAMKPGSSGNLSPNQLVAIVNDLGLDLIVTNPLATHGGTDASVPSPSTLDLQLLRDRVSTQLKQTAMTQIQSIVLEDDTVISPTLEIVETLADTSTPSIGEPGNQLELSLRLRVQSQVVSGEVLNSLVMPIMDSNTPNGYLALPNTLEITQITSPTLGEDGNAHWTISATRKLQIDIPENRVIDIIKGVKVAQASNRLSASLPLAEQAQIVLTPNWWPRLPLLAMRIEVVQPEFR